MALWDSAQIATSITRNLISTSFGQWNSTVNVRVSWANRDYSVKSKGLPVSFSKVHAFACPVHPVFPMQFAGGAGGRRGVIGSVVVRQGVAPGDFIPRSRDTHKIGSQSRQLADVGNTRHIRDQLVHDGQGRNRRIDRRYRDRNQDCLVLSSRAPLGRGALGPTPAMMTSAIGFGRHPRKRVKNPGSIIPPGCKSGNH
jgi:hypothetical protein